MEVNNYEKTRLLKGAYFLVVILSLFYLMKTISEIKGFNFIGGGAPASNVISFEGKGEVSATPDMGTISFTILEDAKSAKDAQSQVTTKEANLLKLFDKEGIDKKDIKTENFSSYPKYEYSNSVCPTPAIRTMGAEIAPVYCPPGKQVLTGYEVSENISVKIHDLTKIGEIVNVVQDNGVSSFSGPNFTIDNEDSLKEQARKMAIDDAKAKAASLSKDLGVHLVRIVNFSENGNYPIMYAAGNMAMKDSAVAPVSAPAPELPTGENKITSNVTITYEIR